MIATHRQADFLSPKNPRYRAWIVQHTYKEMRKDLGSGDLTTQAFWGSKKISARAEVIAKENGVLAGRQEIEFFIKKYTKLKVTFLKKDGQAFSKGETLAKLEGDLHQLMAVERAALNLLGRMSGIATYTRRLVLRAHAINPKVLLAPTRKTLWGLLDKRACVLGGGGTHRLSLDNAILIKHTHLKASGVSVRDFLMAALKNARCKFFEVEVSNVKDAEIAAEIFEKFHKKKPQLPCFVMFDNFPPQKIKVAVTQLKKLYPSVYFEASGRINERNLAAYVKTGVDVISMGGLTHSAPMLDVSLRIK